MQVFDHLFSEDNEEVYCSAKAQNVNILLRSPGGVFKIDQVTAKTVWFCFFNSPNNPHILEEMFVSLPKDIRTRYRLRSCSYLITLTKSVAFIFMIL